MSQAQRTALTSSTTAPPVPGLVIYQSDNTPGLYAYDGTAWVRLGADNLGNHTATQNLDLGPNALVGNGSTGLSITSVGRVGIGTGTADPSSTLQVIGNLAVGVATGLPGSNTSTLFGAYAASYFGLTPPNGADYYRVPIASGCPGRVYYLRNNSTSRSAYIGVIGSNLIYNGVSTVGVSTFEMMTTGVSKTVTAISDGFNWTFIQSGN